MASANQASSGSLSISVETVMRTRVRYGLDLREQCLTTSLESQYNDNQGIKYVIAFQPNPPPLKSGEKRRRNARTAIIKCVTYIHEDSSMAKVIEASFLAVGRNPESLKFKVVGQELRTTAFSIKYSIPGRSPLKDMQLSTTAHFYELLKEAVKKGSPEVKLEITEDVSRCL
jgi:hypothetical protein